MALRLRVAGVPSERGTDHRTEADEAQTGGRHHCTAPPPHNLRLCTRRPPGGAAPPHQVWSHCTRQLCTTGHSMRNTEGCHAIPLPRAKVSADGWAGRYWKGGSHPPPPPPGRAAKHCLRDTDNHGTEKAMKVVRQARLELSGGSTPDQLRPPALEGAQPMPSHCAPDAKCQPQWHL